MFKQNLHKSPKNNTKNMPTKKPMNGRCIAGVVLITIGTIALVSCIVVICVFASATKYTAPAPETDGTTTTPDVNGTAPSEEKTVPTPDVNGTSPDENGTAPAPDGDGIAQAPDVNGTAPAPDVNGTAPAPDENGTAPSKNETAPTPDNNNRPAPVADGETNSAPTPDNNETSPSPARVHRNIGKNTVKNACFNTIATPNQWLREEEQKEKQLPVSAVVMPIDNIRHRVTLPPASQDVSDFVMLDESDDVTAYSSNNIHNAIYNPPPPPPPPPTPTSIFEAAAVTPPVGPNIEEFVLLESWTDNHNQIAGSPPPTSTTGGPKQFTIATYNIRIDVDKAPHRWIDRRDGVVRNIRESNASIVGLQEAQPHSVAYLTAAFPQMRIIGAWRDQSKSEGCPIMFDQSLWTLLEVKTYLLGGSKPKQCTTDSCSDGRTCFPKIGCDNHARVMTHMTLRSTAAVANGITVDVINTHFPLKQELQQACAKQIVAFADTIQNLRPLTTVLVMGDLNTNHEPNEPATAISAFREAQFQDSMNWVDEPTYGPMTHQTLKRDMHRLDYIMYRNRNNSNLKPVQSSVRHFLEVDGKRPSDHEMCVATFTM